VPGGGNADPECPSAWHAGRPLPTSESGSGEVGGCRRRKAATAVALSSRDWREEGGPPRLVGPGGCARNRGDQRLAVALHGEPDRALLTALCPGRPQTSRVRRFEARCAWARSSRKKTKKKKTKKRLEESFEDATRREDCRLLEKGRLAAKLFQRMEKRQSPASSMKRGIAQAPVRRPCGWSSSPSFRNQGGAERNETQSGST